MSNPKTLKSLFKRYRRPGDIVFAWFCFLCSLFLLSQIFDQTAYKAGAKLFAQPRFWPAVSLSLMTGFSALHLLSSAMSERIAGRWREVLLWITSLEYAAWFIGYAFSVPIAGYFPTTILFAVVLVLRVGYRGKKMILAAAGSAVFIALLFKTFLKVNLPSGLLYEQLPDGVRQIMITYF